MGVISASKGHPRGGGLSAQLPGCADWWVGERTEQSVDGKAGNEQTATGSSWTCLGAGGGQGKPLSSCLQPAHSALVDPTYYTVGLDETGARASVIGECHFLLLHRVLLDCCPPGP